MPDQLLTTAEVAEVLRVHPKHVYRLLKRGLPARRVGAEWRFSREDVLAWSGGSTGDAARLETAPASTPPGAPDAAPALVAANGDVAVLSLLALAAAQGPPLLGFVQADMAEAADLLRRRAVLAAGAHAGGFPSHVGDDRVARIHLVTREIGLVHPPGRPVTLEDLARRRLASRPGSAGVRRHLDEALRARRLDPARVHRKALLLRSHLEVALAVAAGRADVGLCSRAWGERAGLAFRPIATEPYGLIVKARDLGDARVVRLCETAQGRAFRAEAGAIRGYDVEGAGDIRYDA
ncbi:DNA binding domain protein, excisionase family [Anaeromyxobacter sp. K]|uniref:helix-turn-helix transcriptional regulator n=1 Tax=Anaeromyxobacter sp. (strain K) TaxID=447217 RepID=UPI00015F8BFE|nr:helix-turn-helix transcriptional regulator [Anaeromyxobacter sp. K]ACG72294.1 DNA binding domain protein, excisionase family [Anaeromyxobacter sp. K]